MISKLESGLGLAVNVRYITKRIVSELFQPRQRSYDMPAGFQVHLTFIQLVI